MMTADRRLPDDWFDGTVPPNVVIDDEAYVETTFSFLLYKSERAEGARVGRGASVYLGTMFDVGKQGRVAFGDFTLCNGARIVCDAEITIGDHTLISWNVVLMDTYRVPFDPALAVGPRLVQACLRRGVILRAVVDTITFCPPLIIARDEIDLLFDAVTEALDVVAGEVAKETRKVA